MEKQASDEFMQQEKFRIEGEVVQVLSAGQPVCAAFESPFLRQI
jgi:hypothetical protein